MIGRGLDVLQGLYMAAVNVKYRSAIRTSVGYLILSNLTLETRLIYQNTLKSKASNIWVRAPNLAHLIGEHGPTSRWTRIDGRRDISTLSYRLYGPEYFETRLGWLARNFKSVGSYIMDPACDTGAVVRYGGTLFCGMVLACAQIKLWFLWA